MTMDEASVAARWRIARWGLIAAVLVAPLAAMQFTDEVAWTGADFAFAAMLLIGAGLAYELAAWRLRGRARLAVGAAILFLVLLVWAQGAVGVF